MIDLGKHAAFIWMAYGVFAVSLTALIVWLIADGARQKAKLAKLDAENRSRTDARVRDRLPS